MQASSTRGLGSELLRLKKAHSVRSHDNHPKYGCCYFVDCEA